MTSIINSIGTILIYIEVISVTAFLGISMLVGIVFLIGRIFK